MNDERLAELIARTEVWVEADKNFRPHLHVNQDILAALRELLALREQTRELPVIEPGTRVRVDHPRYHGEGIAQGDDKDHIRTVAVLLGNGNVWNYERETVTPLPPAPVPSVQEVENG
jgi:hypothetical protein